MKILFVLLSFFVVPLLTGQDKEAILSMLKERDVKVKTILGAEGNTFSEEQREKLQNLINGSIDFSEITKRALLENYDTISEEQREEFVNVFASIIRDNSLKDLSIYRADVSYDSVEISGDSAHVVTTVSLDKVKTSVSYEMIKKDNAWVIADLAIDNVSTAKSYNRTFDRIIKRRGFEALLGSLKKRASKS